MASIVKVARRLVVRENAGRFLRFITVGGIGAVLNLSILYCLTSIGVYYVISGAIAIEAAFIFNFFGNKFWTFGDVEFERALQVLRALLRDHGVRLVGMVVNLLMLWLLTDVFGLYYLLSQLIGAGIASVWNFAGNVLWTWSYG